MSKPLTFLFCLVMLFVACSNNPKNDASADNNATSSEKPSVQEGAKSLEVQNIADGWTAKTINVENGGQTPNIEQLVEAFSRAWPTSAINGKKTVDAPNGWLSSEVEGQTLTACQWKRPNGHQLFSVNLAQPIEPTINVVMFYDYDPAKGTLAPDKSSPTDFKPSFEGNIVEYKLPRTGKDIVINEFVPGWEKYIRHTYAFDGTKHHFARTTIDDYAKMIKLYDDFDDMYKSEDHTLVKYALVDIDQDGNPELWMRSQKEEDGVFFAINQGKIWLLETENYHSTVYLRKGIIQQSGGCGTGCQFSRFTTVKGSKPGDVWNVLTEYGFEDGDEGTSSWEKNGNEIPEAEGDKFMQSLDDDFEFTPQWRPLGNL